MNEPTKGSVESRPMVAQNDIVTRLRNHADECASWGVEDYPVPMLHFAADEIERLRTVLKKANICFGCDQPWKDEAHIYGKTKCCPDCSHEYSEAVRND